MTSPWVLLPILLVTVSAESTSWQDLDLDPTTFEGYNEDENVFRDTDIVRDEEHIKEHLQGQATIDFEKLTPQELEFHYFDIHDTDDDDYLDGLEIMHALGHSLYHKYEKADDMEEGLLDSRTKKGRRLFDAISKNIITTVDNILTEDDHDLDGRLSYMEFSASRRQDAMVSWWHPNGENKNFM